MATRSRIGYVNEAGSIVSAYCHYDGYPQHNGKILLKHYNTIDKVRELVIEGDMSCLRPTCRKVEGHTFDNPDGNVTVYYGRDCGEKNTEAKVCKTKDELVEMADGSWGEYVYLFENGKWTYSPVGDASFADLTDEVCSA